MLLLIIIMTSIYCLIIYNTNAEYMFTCKSKRRFDWATSKNLKIFSPKLFAHTSSLRADNFVLNIKLCHNLTILKK